MTPSEAMAQPDPVPAEGFVHPADVAANRAGPEIYTFLQDVRVRHPDLPFTEFQYAVGVAMTRIIQLEIIRKRQEEEGR